MKKRKLITSCILSLIMCASLLTGATYALLTSEKETNVAISAGKVEVTATIKDLSLHSPAQIERNDDGTVTIRDNSNAAHSEGFANGGLASINENKLSISNMTPGDIVKFNINLNNNSNVSIKYQTQIVAEDGSDLMQYLKITIDGTVYDGGFSSVGSDWVQLIPNQTIKPIAVAIELPIEASNEIVEKTAQLTIKVVAVQGNTYTESVVVPTETEIRTPADLVNFANAVNAGMTFEGKTVKVMNEIDMAGVAYTPAGKDIISFPGDKVFMGTFDGQGFVIKNLTASSKVSEWSCSGLFGGIYRATIQNVILDNANITGSHYVGGIAAYSESSLITNCKVLNSTITSTPELLGEAWDNGDKAGGIIGYIGNADGVVDGCKVDNVTISAYRDMGGIIGGSYGEIKNNTVNEITFNQDLTHNYKKFTSLDDAKIQGNINDIIGRKLGGSEENNTVGEIESVINQNPAI